MKINVVLLLLLFLYLSFLPGCNQEELCLSNQHSLQSGFYSARSKSLKDSLIKNTSIFGLSRPGNLLYANQTLSKIFLPLSFDNDETVFVIAINSLRDTIWIEHSKELRFISRECGFTFDFKIDTVKYTKTFIDSVAVFYPKVKYGENFENVKIFIY